MPLDPQLAQLLTTLASSDAPPLNAGTVEQAREMVRQFAALSRSSGPVAPVAAVEDRSIPGGDGAIGARVYRPLGDTTFPVATFFHGGGWVAGDLDTHDGMARRLCRHAEVIVVSVDYRLAPEHPFPAAVDDAVAASRWLVEHQAELGGNGQVAVCGESAGGALAAVAAQVLHLGGFELAGQFLIYPQVDLAETRPSRSEFAEGYFIDDPTLRWFAQHYLTDGDDLRDPRVSPLRADDLHGLAPAFVVTAEFDPLRDEAEAYAVALQAAGVKTVNQRCDGMIHAFFDMGAFSPAAERWVAESCARFGALLRTAERRRRAP